MRCTIEFFSFQHPQSCALRKGAVNAVPFISTHYLNAHCVPLACCLTVINQNIRQSERSLCGYPTGTSVSSAQTGSVNIFFHWSGSLMFNMSSCL